MISILFFATASALANPQADKTEAKDDRPKTAYSAESEAKSKPYVFGWMGYSEPNVKLRGGRTTGVPVTLAEEASEHWTSLQEDGLDDRERDRRAILAMTGDYRISFDFLEVELYGDDAELTKPYRSWATERVIALEETEDMISLQHIIVMFMQLPDGSVSEPMLVKHWRQDWEYEPQTALEFIGEEQWETRPLTEDERTGQWQQTVYQVDDSPRYAMRGQWEHNGSYSAWSSESAWRPLPRREHTVRSDYHALVGTNRLTILPTGWVHSQDNIKTVLSRPKVIHAENPARARELGINRYERIQDFDFSAAETYWAKTSEYWAKVRSAWAEHLSVSDTVKVATMCGEERVYKKLFALATDVSDGTAPSGKKLTKKIDTIMSCAVTPIDQL